MHTIRHMDIPETESLGELDLAIVHALQIDARAPWTKIASTVGADAATVARHWQAMSEESLAWLTGWPTPERWSTTTDVAMVLLDRSADDQVIERIAGMPWVLGIDDTSAGFLVLVAASSGLAVLGDRVRELEEAGAPVLRMDVAASIAAEDSSWRLAVLSRSQQRVMRQRRDDDGSRAPRPEVVAELADALDDDPRMPAATLARALGVSEATARRTVDRAIASGLLRLGCDVAMPAAGYRRGAVLWARADDVEDAAVRAQHTAQAHRVGVLVGPAPLFVCVRARTLTALTGIERDWGEGIEVVDRWTVLRGIKRNGHLLDAAGRTRGRVPLAW